MNFQTIKNILYDNDPQGYVDKLLSPVDLREITKEQVEEEQQRVDAHQKYWDRCHKLPK